MTGDAFKKIETLRRRYVDSDFAQRDLDDTEKKLRRALALQNFSEQETVQLILKEAKGEIARINMLLLHDRELTSEQRLGLFHERDVHTFWIQRLDPEEANREVEEIVAGVDNELEEE